MNIYESAVRAYASVPPQYLHKSEVRLGANTAEDLYAKLSESVPWDDSLMDQMTLFGRPVRRDATVPYGEVQFWVKVS